MAAGHHDARFAGVSFTRSPLMLAAALAASLASGMVVAVQVGSTPAATTISQRVPVAVFDAVQFRAEERQRLSPGFDAVQFRAEERRPLFEPAP